MSRHGTFVPLITPLDQHGAVCRQSVAQLLAHSRHTASGYIPCLTSGEGWRLSAEQWQDMLRFTLAEAGERSVIVGIERPTTAEVLDYARQAEQLGASAIMLTSPFGAEVGQAAILEHYRRLHDSTELAIYIYNESALSGNETAFATLLQIAELPRVVGIKDSSEHELSPAQIDALQARGLAYYIGWEHRLAGGMPADGNVVALANLEPMLCRVAMDVATPALQAEIRRLSEAYQLFSEDWYRYVKQALKARGVIGSDRTVAA
ncbi:4-hydroxy-tetrahydrodipicolinate synthase [Pseudomonas benzenivorans]|nr:dihydrodipicolinate synthase family protein [Pseudomonas benzenivorans]SDH03172.1 4-hydroxy-tetrahydrodipicolinate synthase [Pseudomonas benzenivorans]